MASTRVKTVAILTAREGKEHELEELLRSMTGPSRAEPGNIHYNLWRARERPGEFVIDELYTDGEAAAAHRASPHYQGYLGRINELATRHVIPLDAIDTI